MTDLEIAGYLDRGLLPADRDRLEDHMADCLECRQKVAEAHRLLAKVRRPRRFATLGTLAAVAAAALIILSPELTKQRQPAERATRDAIASSSLAGYEPIGTAHGQLVRFVWGAARGATSYRITLSSPDGTTLWSATVRDTIAVLPSGVSLQAGSRYVWFADAVLGDGSTISTGLREFTVEAVAR